MTLHVFVACATCREALVLEWDPASFLVDDPLGGQGAVEGEVAEAALLYGAWPGGDEAPTPLAAGAWAALATRAVAFARCHLAHPDSAGMLIAGQPPAGTTPIPAERFAFPAPAPAPSASGIGATALVGVRGMTIDRRLDLATQFGAASLGDAMAAAGAQEPESRLLAGWLAPDAQDDERLLALVTDDSQGPVAEEALAVRIVLGTADPGLRRQRLLAVAEAAYARLAWLSPGVRTTPYDRAAPVARIQAAAVERLVAAGRIDSACEVAVRCAVPATRLGGLRETVGNRIFDPSVPAAARLRLVERAATLFPDLVGELRRERGLARDPLPDAPVWSKLTAEARLIASLTVAPEAVHLALAAAEVSVVMVALELIRTLASLDPGESMGFAAAVRALCRDGRTEPRPIQVRLCARARDVHALLFADCGGASAWEALTEVTDAMLSAWVLRWDRTSAPWAPTTFRSSGWAPCSFG